MKTANLQNRLYFIAFIILLVGLLGSVLIYLAAGNPSDGSMVDDYQNTKSYVRNLELYGGKMNLLMAEFSDWFDGLWHGRSLATTVACITVFLSACFCLVAYKLPSLHSNDREKDNP
jgi:hypothetical protein